MPVEHHDGMGKFFAGVIGLLLGASLALTLQGRIDAEKLEAERAVNQRLERQASAAVMAAVLCEMSVEHGETGNEPSAFTGDAGRYGAEGTGL